MSAWDRSLARCAMRLMVAPRKPCSANSSKAAPMICCLRSSASPNSPSDVLSLPEGMSASPGCVPMSSGSPAPHEAPDSFLPMSHLLNDRSIENIHVIERLVKSYAQSGLVGYIQASSPVGPLASSGAEGLVSTAADLC